MIIKENPNFYKSKTYSYEQIDDRTESIETQRTVEITQEFFVELLTKASRYDLLKQIAEKSTYLSEAEKLLYRFDGEDIESDVEVISP